MLIVIFTDYMAKLQSLKAPLFALGQSLPRSEQRFVSQHVIGQVPQSDFGSGSN